MTGVFIFVMRVSHEQYHLEFDQLTNRQLARQYVGANLLVREPPLTAHNFSTSLTRITSINHDIAVYVLDAGGAILAASAPGNQVVRKHVSLGPIRQFLGDDAEFPLLGDDPTDADSEQVFSAAPLSIPDCPAAYLYIVFNRHDDTSPAAALKTTYALTEGAGVILTATLLAIVGSGLFLRLLTRRLAVLQESMERFRDSRFSDPVGFVAKDRSTNDEVEQLRRLFLELAGRIREQMLELQNTNEMRRELLANLSHDLRTPLTTLQAHLELLSTKDDLPAEERSAYLRVTLQQCRRLVSLIEQLLQLAKLDSQQVLFEPEPFQVAELMQDVVMKFALAARQGGVALTAEQPRNVPLVHADIGLIERVLDNLTDNALRHAGSGGRVTVRLVPTLRKTVRVELHDTGPGIPESERKRVFDRFYRGDKSRSSDSGHSGLGLSIANGILKLHGGVVDFTTDAKAGTTFFFELPVAPLVMSKTDRAAR